MRSSVLVRIAKSSNLIVAVGLAAFGVFALVEPNCSQTAVCYAVATLLLLCGICKLIGYFSKDLYRLAFQFDLSIGIVFAAVGSILLIRSPKVLETVCILLGVTVLMESIFKMKTAFDAKNFGLQQWFWIFLLAIVAGVFGIALLCRPPGGPQTWTELLGATCIADGILNIVEKCCSVKIVKKPFSDPAENTENFFEEL